MPKPTRDLFAQHMGGLQNFAESYGDSKLKRSRSEESLTALIRKVDIVAAGESKEMWANIENLTTRVGLLKPDCKIGCDHCCYQVVAATIPEVLNVAAYVRANFSAEQQEELKTKLANYMRDSAPYRDKIETSRLCCAFLVDGKCSIYGVRPSPCQWFNSTDVKSCIARRSDESGPFKVAGNYLMAMPFAVLAKGVKNVLERYNLFSGNVDFLYGLKITFDNPDAAEQYLAGVDLYAPAKLDPEEQSRVMAQAIPTDD